uniref:Uncharacterized protein n=1 Tax=viral metagenome TaxID=1070528 RepID=A0A6M3ISI1_9ZZZZ
MPINFNATNPAITQFNSRMSAGDAARRQEEQDFTARMQLEQQQGADTGLRNAISAYYAQNRGGAAPGPAAQPQMAPGAPVPNPAATTPIVSPDQSMAPADNPDYGGPSRAAPMPNAAPRAGVDVPATVAGPPVAAAPAGPTAAASAQPGSSFGPMMDELAKQPGSGKNMLSLFSTDISSQRASAVENRKMQAEGNKQILGFLKDGDVKMAQATAKQYGINIPDDVWKNRALVMNLRLGANLAKTMGIKDEQAVHFVQGFTEGIVSGLPEDQAVMMGLKQIPKDGFEIKGTVTDENNNVQAFDKYGKVKPLGVKARRPGSGDGTGGAGSKQRQYAEWRIKTLVGAGMTQQQAEKLVAGGTSTRPVTAQQRLSLARQLMTMKGSNYKPVYATLQDALAAVDAATAASEGPTADPAAAEPASQGPAGTVQRMRFDANGNEIQQ